MFFVVARCSLAKLCLTLCDPMDYTVHGILQARIVEWVAVPFSRGSSQPRDQSQVSHIAGRFFPSWATREAQEYQSGKPIPSAADLSNPGIELGSPALQTDSLPAELLQLKDKNYQTLLKTTIAIYFLHEYTLDIMISKDWK